MLGWLVAGLAAWWFFFRKPSGVVAAGSLSSMSLDNASMGAHQIRKNIGETVTATVTWTGSTKDFQGRGINWTYRVRCYMQLAGTVVSSTDFFGPAQEAAFLQAFTDNIIFNIPSTLSDGVYDVVAVLQAHGSDGQGISTGAFADIPGVTMTHPSAINLRTTGPAIPQGGIGSVDVAQILSQMRL